MKIRCIRTPGTELLKRLQLSDIKIKEGEIKNIPDDAAKALIDARCVESSGAGDK